MFRQVRFDLPLILHSNFFSFFIKELLKLLIFKFNELLLKVLLIKVNRLRLLGYILQLLNNLQLLFSYAVFNNLFFPGFVTHILFNRLDRATLLLIGFNQPLWLIYGPLKRCNLIQHRISFVKNKLRCHCMMLNIINLLNRVNNLTCPILMNNLRAILSLIIDSDEDLFIEAILFA